LIGTAIAKPQNDRLILKLLISARQEGSMSQSPPNGNAKPPRSTSNPLQQLWRQTQPVLTTATVRSLRGTIWLLEQAATKLESQPPAVPPTAPASNLPTSSTDEAVAATEQAQPDLDDGAYCAVVRRLKEEIAAGEVYQIVPSRTFQAPCSDPLAGYAALRRLEPHSYRFFVQGEDFTLFGASPETSVRVFREGSWATVEVRPIAGTRPRGATPDEDDRLESELRLDGKELAEHMMLVDLARNDVARISIPGTRRVARLMTVERYARVMHLVSSVTGRLAIGFDALDALSACLNVGTLTGAPKIRAMQLLREVERSRRGPYGGAIGWINGAGMMDTAVVIRSAFVRDGTAFVRAGAGVVHDSDPQAEADETRRKASALLSVLAAISAETEA
jgi:anthranilate synthase component 1